MIAMSAGRVPFATARSSPSWLSMFRRRWRSGCWARSWSSKSHRVLRCVRDVERRPSSSTTGMQPAATGARRAISPFLRSRDRDPASQGPDDRLSKRRSATCLITRRAYALGLMTSCLFWQPGSPPGCSSHLTASLMGRAVRRNRRELIAPRAQTKKEF